MVHGNSGPNVGSSVHLDFGHDWWDQTLFKDHDMLGIYWVLLLGKAPVRVS